MTIKRLLNREEAESLTVEIQKTGTRLWEFVYKAWDGEIWVAMERSSWKEYVEKDLRFSESYSFRILNQAKVIMAIEEATDDLPTGESVNITEHQARTIKPHLEEVTERIEQGEEPMAVVKDVTKMERLKKTMNERAFTLAKRGNHSLTPYSQTDTTRTLACRKCIGYINLDYHLGTITGLEEECKPVNFDRQSKKAAPTKPSMETLRDFQIGENRALSHGEGETCNYGTGKKCFITNAISHLNQEGRKKDTLIRYYSQHFGNYIYVTKIELVERQ